MSQIGNPATALPEAPGPCVRALMRRAGQATLASALARDGSGRAYASLVLAAVDHDASPILLISDLADHTRNLKANDQAALLFDGTAAYDDPLAGPRATVLGSVRAVEDPTVRTRLKARCVARHPGAGQYADFADFGLYRMAPDSAHLVAGFGRVHWLAAEDVVFDTAGFAPLAEAEADIVWHMNADHAEAVNLIGSCLTGGSINRPQGPGWVMTGVDPEGIDLRRGRNLARADFERPVGDAEAAREALIRLTREARRRGRAE